ncbi:primosomal protein N' [Fictibacillus iocasae]|uniref:Replication restart protein PriA n=1 Tax=Fictibacillus iocasae TaxID=2715437 RepID=A0ABW2NQL6_9BACL
MMIAQVVVDLPSGLVNKSFDYKVPDSLKHSILPGMRVVVPFGPRKLQGFVTQIVLDTDVEKLKEIQEVLDPVPVLTEELLLLGQWLSDHTLSFYITVFQAMLPAAMKASYSKSFVLAKEPAEDFPLASLYSNRSEVTLDEVIQEHPQMLAVFQQQARAGVIDVIYKVKDQAVKKKKKYVTLKADMKAAEEFAENLPARSKKQKDVLMNLVLIPFQELQELVRNTGANSAAVAALEKKGLVTIEEREVYRDPFAGREERKTEPLELTDLQQQAILPIINAMEKNSHETVLLHGVTGSGKTEIYLQSIDKALQEGNEAIVLVPEIALTPQMVTRFKGRFGSKVAVLHSGLSKGEKYDEWRKILRKEVTVVVGARSAVFAPFENLGLIIIDEEHETSYKQDDNPRYHARDVAIWRGQHHSCPVILGSATPSLESYARAQKGVYTLSSLTKRVMMQELPPVEITDMRNELHEGNRSMFSRRLMEEMNSRLERGEQIVLFLNRRGYSSFVLCRDCGYAVTCPHCDISLTYHKKGQQLKCHYCGHEEYMPSNCPSCSSEHIRYFGTGTQKVEEELAKLLPEARVIRMDVDTTRRKGSHEKLLTAFGNEEADILLGTQMIAKGLDFPKVTLVGVLAADSMLHLPDFRASEKTFQLLTQVSGRAGRDVLPGKVVIQTYDCSHYSIQCASEHDYLTFYNREMLTRRSMQYPPYYFLSMMTVSSPDLLKVVEVSEKAAEYLQSKLNTSSIILGPVASPIARLKDRYRYQVMVKYKNEPDLRLYIREILNHFQRDIAQTQLQIAVDMNVQNVM